MAELKLYNHPDYDYLSAKWQAYKDLKDGEHEVLTAPEYLPRYNIEKTPNRTVDVDGQKVVVAGGQDLLMTRLQLSQYTNFPEKALRRYTSIIFKNDPDISEVEELFADNPDNVDGDKHNLIDWIKNVLFPERFVFGYCFTLVAGYKDEDKFYLKTLPALSVKDWQITNGTLELLRYEYQVIEPRKSSSEQPKTVTYSDEYIKEDNSVVLKRYKKEGDKWKLVEEMPVELFTELPIEYLKGDSFIKTAEPEIRKYHMLDSSLMNQLYHQGTQKIFVTGDIDPQTVVSMGESSVTILRTRDGNSAGVTAIEPTNPTMLRSKLIDTEANIYKSFFHMTRIMNADSAVGESDLTLDKQKEDLLNVIKSEIKELERFVNVTIENFAIATGKPNFQGEIKFDDDITIQDIEFMLREELAYLEEIKKYPTWYKEQMKQVASRQGFRTEQEELILDEIEATSDTVRNAQATITIPPINL